MSPRPSDPLLEFLRAAAKQKRLSTAELARRTGLDRAELKRRLAGTEPMTVDDFVLLSQALELSAADVSASSVRTAEADATPESIDRAHAPDPEGNLAEQTLRLGFALGIDLLVQLDPRQLDDSGVPRSVLTRFSDGLPLRFEARNHRHMRPRFEPDHFECLLLFGAPYTCAIPWSAFRVIGFNLPEGEARAPEPSPSPARPQLRVIK